MQAPTSNFRDLLTVAGFGALVDDPLVQLCLFLVVGFFAFYIIPPQSLFNFFLPMVTAFVLLRTSNWLNSNWESKRAKKRILDSERKDIVKDLKVLKTKGRSSGSVVADQAGLNYRPLVKGANGKNGVRFSDRMSSDGVDPVESFLSAEEDDSQLPLKRQLRKREKKRTLYTGRRKGRKSQE
jgi:hypothetical protein